MKIAAAVGIIAGAVGSLGLQQLPRPTVPTFRSVAEVVLVPVAVTDRGRPVTDLSAADFELLDNGVRQAVTAVSLEALPIDVTLLLDVSGSVDDATRTRFAADVHAVAAALSPADRVRLLTFATMVVDASGWRAGGVPIALRPFAVGGGTSLYDGLAAAVLATESTDRPHLVCVQRRARHDQPARSVDG